MPTSTPTKPPMLIWTYAVEATAKTVTGSAVIDEYFPAEKHNEPV